MMPNFQGPFKIKEKKKKKKIFSYFIVFSFLMFLFEFFLEFRKSSSLETFNTKSFYEVSKF